MKSLKDKLNNIKKAIQSDPYNLKKNKEDLQKINEQKIKEELYLWKKNLEKNLEKNKFQYSLFKEYVEKYKKN